ncbi:AbiH family protein [Pseudomonas sp. NPDC086278]
MPKMPRMDATTLYIIGNGFDLHHGLPTSYSDFKAPGSGRS